MVKRLWTWWKNRRIVGMQGGVSGRSYGQQALEAWVRPIILPLRTIERRRFRRKVPAKLETVERIPIPGWLAPDGTFVTVGGRGHGRAAHEIIAPGTPYEPDQTNYELELERRRYLKLMVSTYWAGWCRPDFRITRRQQDVVVDWYLERGLRCPEWVTR